MAREKHAAVRMQSMQNMEGYVGNTGKKEDHRRTRKTVMGAKEKLKPKKAKKKKPCPN